MRKKKGLTIILCITFLSVGFSAISRNIEIDGVSAEEYTISCTQKSGDNNKIKVKGFAFIINP